MRWLVLGSSLSSQNGYGVLCRSLAAALGHAEGLSLDVFTGDGHYRWWPGRRNLKSEWISVHPRLWRLYVLFDLATLLLRARGPYDGVLVLVEHYAAAGWLFARWKKTPFVATQCGTYAVRLPREFPFFRKVLENADRIVPISRYTQKRMEEEGIRGRFATVPLGVDRSVFRPTGAPRRPEVLFVGNLKARKGLDFLIEALAQARSRLPELQLRVVGEIDKGSQSFADLAIKIAAGRLKVEFAGPLTERQLVEAYGAARLNALPSKSEPFFFEGFGLIHLEANACGTLTVGTLDSGNEDAVQEGFGYLVRYGDAGALADAIVAALTAEPYPVLPVEKLRTWDDVARDYSGILGEAARRASVTPAKTAEAGIQSAGRPA